MLACVLSLSVHRQVRQRTRRVVLGFCCWWRATRLPLGCQATCHARSSWAAAGVGWGGDGKGDCVNEEADGAEKGREMETENGQEEEGRNGTEQRPTVQAAAHTCGLLSRARGTQRKRRRDRGKAQERARHTHTYIPSSSVTSVSLAAMAIRSALCPARRCLVAVADGGKRRERAKESQRERARANEKTGQWAEESGNQPVLAS